MGVELISEIVQKNGQDFPLVDSNNIRGGFYSVPSILDRDAIPNKRRKEGMVCYVQENRSYYKLENNTWIKGSLSGGGSVGIPILDLSLIDKLTLEGLLPEDYIFIPSELDLDGEITNNSFKTSENGSYTDILFKSLRALQLEVNRLKNAFNYGIQSYTGTDTAMSTQGSIPGSVEEEPLWAIEEGCLSKLPEASISINDRCELLPKSNLDLSLLGKIIIKNLAYWEDTNKVLSLLNDSKILLYLSSNSKNILLVLKNIDDFLKSTVLDLNRFDIPKVDKYDITVILSRKTTSGNNYIWVSIRNNTSTLLEGYLNGYSVSLNLVNLLSRYTYYKYIFNNLSLYKCNTCTKYEDFSSEIIPTTPTEDDFKYRVAHIAIRSVKDYSEITAIINLSPNNELIWNELEQQLYIITAKGAVKIGSATNTEDNGMTKEELIKELENRGIIYSDANGLQLSQVSDITFVNQETNKKFKFEVDAYGKLRSNEIPLTSTTDKANNTTLIDNDIRGFVGLIGRQDFKNSNGTQLPRDIPFEGNADRIKIGAFYITNSGLEIFGCSHAYIELENTSNKDFDLNGCYLHYAHGKIIKGDSTHTTTELLEHLSLKGTIKAGSTYLIRGKKYAEFQDLNVKIKVKEFDLEWYAQDGQLLNLIKDDWVGFALTYDLPELLVEQSLQIGSKTNTPDSTPEHPIRYIDVLKVLDNGDKVISSYYPNEAKCPYVFSKNFIDAVYFKGTPNNNPWAGVNKGNPIKENKRDCIYKNTFELDPAMQAFQGLNKFDSSRVRWQSGNDILAVAVDEDYIEFPKTKGKKMRIDLYTPLASYENKNVCTDKTLMDVNRPNVIFCSMGIDVYRTRTFNWVSSGLYDEYVWIRKKGEQGWTNLFESYKKKESDIEASLTYPRRKEYSMNTNNIVYKRFVGRFPGAGALFTSHKCVVELLETNTLINPEIYEYCIGRALIDKKTPDPDHTSKIKTFVLYPKTFIPQIYLHTDEQGFDWIQYLVWGAAALDLDKKIKEDLGILIQDESGQTVEITDTSKWNKIMPILVDTGDVVQNGTRINEWLDYYSGGECLFDHLEAMDVVGNNDLCDTDPSILGTGDDDGKSNSFYFHIFHCQDINEDPLVKPIINNTYIPSLYYLDTETYRILMINSELTYINCRDWFKLSDLDGNVSNIYTGFKLKLDLDTTVPALDIYDNERFRNSLNMDSSDLDVPIYTLLYYLTDPIHSLGTTKKIICACHEMPFTVITNSSLRIIDMEKKLFKNTENAPTELEKYTRSINEFNLLIGSHLNLIDPRDVGKGTYWFSRLLEYRGIKLCIGGHKHTYACSYPVCENYNYTEGDILKSSITDGPMKMDVTLENDSSKWFVDSELTYTERQGDLCDEVGRIPETTKSYHINTTKVPLIKYGKLEPLDCVRVDNSDPGAKSKYYGILLLPCQHITDFISNSNVSANKGVIYFMCLATGYKLTSNKELPSLYLKFSQLKPKTTYDGDSYKDKAAGDLLNPMYSIINLGDTVTIKLIRVSNILGDKYKFNLFTYSTNLIAREFLIKEESDPLNPDEYGLWSALESPLITIA